MEKVDPVDPGNADMCWNTGNAFAMPAGLHAPNAPPSLLRLHLHCSASSRTLAASSSISRLLTRNKVKTFEKVLPELEEEGLVSAEWLNDQDAASTVSLASLLTPGNAGTATAAAAAVAGGNAGDAGSNAGSTSTAGSSSQQGSAGGTPAAQNAAPKGTAQVAQARTGPGAAIAAASAANNPNRLCSDIYRQWAETHGSKSLQKIKSGFAHVPVQDVQLV